MGGLVQQPAAPGAHRQHPAGRSRRTLLRYAGTASHGGVTQTKRPAANPERFRMRPHWLLVGKDKKSLMQDWLMQSQRQMCQRNRANPVRLPIDALVPVA